MEHIPVVTAAAMDKSIPILPTPTQDVIENKNALQSHCMQNEYYRTYFGKKIAAHLPSIRQVIENVQKVQKLY